MITLEKNINTSIDIMQATAYRGILNGSITVKENVLFVLYGTVVNNVYLESGSIVEIYGTVSKDIINQGGTLKIHGVINGTVYNLKGELTIDKNALVKNVSDVVKE